MITIQDMTPPALPLARYRLSFTTMDPVRLPDYAGSAWRGVFGHANRHLPYIIHALDQAGRRGIGKRGGQLLLERVDQQTDAGSWRRIFVPGERLTPAPAVVSATPSCPSSFELVLKTPLRIKAEGHYLTPEAFRFSALFSNLLRRISLLTTFHTDTPLETDFAGLSRAARRIRIVSGHTRLRWQEWNRYSSRQDTLLQMGGLLGRVTLIGADLEPFWPYLWLGQWTHAGKGASMGLGRYGIDVINRAP